MELHLFPAEVYQERRKVLSKRIESGFILILGNGECPKNYTDNTYHFRQDSNFLYYAGLDIPDFSLLIDVDGQKSYLCGDDRSVELIVWMGKQEKVASMAERVGIENTLTNKQLEEKLREATAKRLPIHYLPPYRGFSILKVASWLGIDNSEVQSRSSIKLIQAVIRQRSIKQSLEIMEMEKALEITREMHLEVMYETKAGIRECDLVSALMSIAHKYDVDTAYPVILTINGQTLHNHDHSNLLSDGQLLLGDFGAESPMYYAGDITRTLPVNGKFSGRQREIYEIVLEAQKTAIEMLRPGVAFRDIHLASARTIASGLKELGLMKGSPEEAVDAGAHALFFPHGLGHMIGLDVHDMEDLGENYVGYDAEYHRSDQFGLRSLRMAKKLGQGHVVTVEPGVYFIPELIDMWAAEKINTEFICYDKLQPFRSFGGIRIEDNYLINTGGSQLLGTPIPKEIKDVEFLMNA